MGPGTNQPGVFGSSLVAGHIPGLRQVPTDGLLSIFCWGGNSKKQTRNTFLGFSKQFSESCNVIKGCLDGPGANSLCERREAPRKEGRRGQAARGATAPVRVPEPTPGAAEVSN